MTQLPSRHKKNFEDYITQYAISNDLSMNDPMWQVALAAARRLDYIGDRNATTNMQLTPSPPSLMRRLFALLRRREQQVHLSELDDIQAFLRQAPKLAAQQSEIIWGPLRNGFGTWVIAILRPGGQQKGSRPTPSRLRDAARWKLLGARRLLNSKALYVRGHLLLDYAGGPGVDINLIILTAAPGGDFGANHANWVHRYLVEGPLLWAYRNMHGLFGTPTITEIYYQVTALYGRTPRTGTVELLEITQAYKKAAKLVYAKSVAEGGGIGTEPTHLEVMRELALESPSPHLHDAMFAVTAKPTENWQQVYGRMSQNQGLWQFEDENVPRALELKYSWLENGILRGPWEDRLTIMLPTSLAAKFKL